MARQGQGSVEYIIILAIALLVAGAVVYLLGGSSETQISSTLAESNVYWSSSAYPIRITEATHVASSPCQQALGADTAGYVFVVTNADSSEPVTLTGVNVDGANRDFCLYEENVTSSVLVNAEKKQTIGINYVKNCHIGSNHELALNFSYKKGAFSNRVEVGLKTLVLPCNSQGGVALLSITTPFLADGSEGVYYSFSLQASGGIRPYAWSISGLPSGLSYSPSTGTISGTPSAGTAGNHSISVTVTDSNSPLPNSTSKTFQLAIAINVQPLNITTAYLPNATEGLVYSTAVTATGGSTPYSWGATGLPSGISINSSTGLISGTPSVGTYGNHSVVVSVTDSTSPSSQAANKTFLLYVDKIWTDVNSCRNIYSDNNYKLTADIIDFDSLNDCFVANHQQNINFDCQGHTVDGTDAAWYSKGFWLYFSNNIAISNCVISDFGRGIQLDNSNYNTINGITTTSNVNYGIKLFPASSYNTISNIVANSNNVGIGIYNSFDGSTSSGSNYNVFTDITAIDNSQEGIYSFYSIGNIFTTLNIVNSNLGIVLQSSSQNSFSSGSITSNSNCGVCISDANSNSFTSLTTSSNGQGVQLTNSNSNYFSSFSNEIGVIPNGGNSRYYSNTPQNTTSKSNIGWWPLLNDDGSGAYSWDHTAWYNGTSGGTNQDGTLNSSLHYWYSNQN